MPQLLLQGFPEGAIRIGPVLSILNKEKRVTYFTGGDNFFSHDEGDHASFRFAIATLITNKYVRACDVEASTLGIAHRTLMNWTRQLSQKGPEAFFKPTTRGGARILTQEKSAQCERFFQLGYSVSASARLCGVKESTLRKAIQAGRIRRVAPQDVIEATATTKSQRALTDSQAAEGLGTACTRAGERMAAAVGLIDGAHTRFEHCQDVPMGGLLAGLPALCANGLLRGLDQHFSLPKGFYHAMHIVTLLGFMALARIRRPEGLRHLAPGELGKVTGLDRVPEVKTLREKVSFLAKNGATEKWMKELSRGWMEEDPQEAGYVYVDGHVRVYHGAAANLPRRYVSREKLCLRGTTDYWVNDALGRPFFVVSKAVSEGLVRSLLEDIVPELLRSIPHQPTAEQLERDPLLHRFVVIFDREGSVYGSLSKLWDDRIGAITYRKDVKDLWDEADFKEYEVPTPASNATTRMKLAFKETRLCAAENSMPVLEVRRLTQSGHQTAIITTARNLSSPEVAGRMFARWCQENFFAYMMEHYDLDALVEHSVESIPGTTLVINPRWRENEKAISAIRIKIRKLQAELGKQTIQSDGKSILEHSQWIDAIERLTADKKQLTEKRRLLSRKVTIDSLPQEERPTQLAPLSKMFTDTIKMIAYRAETALVAIIRKHLTKEDEARALIRELFVSSADLVPNEEEKTLTVRIHPMACPSHNKAIQALLLELTNLNFIHPQTNLKIVYELIGNPVKCANPISD